MANRDTIISYYENVLLRTPSEAEIRGWEQALNNGQQTFDTLLSAFINSPEAQNFVEPIIRLYQAAFGRQPDNAGLNGWVDAMRGGMTFAQIAEQFTKSQEFHNIYGDNPAAAREAFIINLYENVLGRAPDAAGLRDWLNSGASLTDLLIGFTNSPEFVQNTESAVERVLTDLSSGEQLDTSKDLFEQPVTNNPDDPGPNPNPNPNPGPDPGPAYNLSGGVLSLAFSGTTAITEEPDHSWRVKNGDVVTTLTTAQIAGITRIEVSSSQTVNIQGSALNDKALQVHGDGHVNVTGVVFTPSSNGNPVSVSTDLTEVRFDADTTVNGSKADYFKAVWKTVDVTYGQIQGTYGNGPLFGTNENGPSGPTTGYTDGHVLAQPILGETTAGAAGLANRQLAVDLAVEYIQYLQAGGAPLTDFAAKTSVGGRLQSIHDNILANVSNVGIDERNLPNEADVRARVPDEYENRPIYSGNPGDKYGANHIAVLKFDYDHGWARADYVHDVVGNVDAAATTGGQMYFGSGNLPTNYIMERHEGAGIEVGLKVHYRTGIDITPNAIDADGTAHFTVPSGSQVVDPAHQVYAADPNRAAWSVDFSELVGLNGRTDNLANYTAKLFVDVDPTAGTNYIVLTQVKNASGATPWISDRSAAEGILDQDGSISTLSQNSFNYGFGFIKNYIDADANTAGVQPYTYGAGSFDIKLEVYNSGGVKLVGSHIVVDVA